MADRKKTEQSEQKPKSKAKTLKIEALADRRLMKLTNGKKLIFAKTGDIKEVETSLAVKYIMTNDDGETILRAGLDESFRIV